MANKRARLFTMLIGLASAGVFAGAALAAPPVKLLTPLPNAIIAQNNPSIGCACDLNRGCGFEIIFDWNDYQLTNKFGSFTLEAFHAGSALAALREEGLTASTFTWQACQAFVIDTNLDNWFWEVTAFDKAGNFLNDSIGSGPGAAQRPFSFAPCRLASGAGCNAPAGP